MGIASQWNLMRWKGCLLSTSKGDFDEHLPNLRNRNQLFHSLQKYCFFSLKNQLERIKYSFRMFNVILEKLYTEPFLTWWSSNLVRASDTRKAFIEAIKIADKYNLLPLITFAKWYIVETITAYFLLLKLPPQQIRTQKKLNRNPIKKPTRACWLL